MLIPDENLKRHTEKPIYSIRFFLPEALGTRILRPAEEIFENRQIDVLVSH